MFMFSELTPTGKAHKVHNSSIYLRRKMKKYTHLANLLSTLIVILFALTSLPLTFAQADRVNGTDGYVYSYIPSYYQRAQAELVNMPPYTMADLIKCVDGKIDLRITHDAGSVQIYVRDSADETLKLGEKPSAILWRCLNLLGQADEMEVAIYYDDAQLPDGTEPLSERHAEVAPNTWVSNGGEEAGVRAQLSVRQACRNVLARQMVILYRAEASLDGGCNYYRNSDVYIPRYTDCLNPHRPDVRFQSVRYRNSGCESYYRHRYVHHGCRLTNSNGSPALRYTGEVRAGTSPCIQGNIYSFCATRRFDANCFVRA